MPGGEPQPRNRRAQGLAALLRHPELGFIGRSIGIASLVGVAGGLSAIGFELLIRLFKELALFEPFGLSTGQEGLGQQGLPWWIALVPALGGLAAGLLIHLFAPAARGHGTEQVIQSFHHRDGRIAKRVIAVKAVASALTIGSGGSAGQEGPVAQIGAGIGSNVADAFGLSDRDRRLFLLAGATAGIGAMFSAPLGAALFVPEVLYKKPEFEGDAIIPCIVAAILAHTTKVTLQPGDHKEIRIPDEILDSLGFHGARELPVYVVLALCCALVGWVYVRCFRFAHGGFARMRRVPAWVRPGLGGLLLGLLAMAIAPLAGTHGLFFGGYGLMVDSIRGELGVQLLLLLIAGKILSTSLSIGSGGSGGMFAPSLAIGAMLGALVGQLASELDWFGPLDPASFALVGMGGFFAGVAKTPVAATIIVCEMTGSYALLTPLMLVAVVHVLLARGWTLYESQVDGLVDSPAHAGEFIVDVLERMSVADVLSQGRPPTLIDQHATLREALQVVSSAVASYFPVVDAEQRLVGIFSLSDIRRIFLQHDVQDMVIVKDFMVEDVVTVGQDEDLNEALRLLNEYAIHELPVVSAEDPGTVLAMLSRNVIGSEYHRRLEQLRAARA